MTYHNVKKLVTHLTGIVPIIRDMCDKSCVAYTGPFAEYDHCPKCGESRYDPALTGKIPRKQFHTFPIAPQLQAIWRTPEGADSMGYCASFTDKIIHELQENDRRHISPYVDFFNGSDYLDAVQDGRIAPTDMVLMMSIDGAQLYLSKESDCWMWLWIIFDREPDTHYKKKYVLPSRVYVPGPYKPKNSDSYMYVGLYHRAAIQKEGLSIWDARKKILFKSYVFLVGV